MQTLNLALDWRPNTNHTGFYVAKHLGFYEDLGISLNIISTEDDNYILTPSKKLELGMVDFALCPMESLISYRTKSSPFKVVGVATIFQEDISAICTLKASGIERPKDLDRKVYASYKARYEDRIVEEMIKNDGGAGDLKYIYPNKLGIWNTLISNVADATWIFINWEGIEAETQGIELNLYKMSDYNIPYGYSPIIMTSDEKLQEHNDLYKLFIEATKRGFQYAINNYEYSAEILRNYLSESDRHIDLVRSQIMTSPNYGPHDNWGEMDFNRVDEFLNWIKEKGLEQFNFTAKDIITNDLLR